MDLLPNELISIILNFIHKITDKRQFSKTCILYNNITKIFIKNLCVYNCYIVGDSYFELYPNKYCVERFTIELCDDEYFNLIPDSYLFPHNKIIVKKLIQYNKLKLLQIAAKNGCILDRYACDWAAQYGHKHILMWLRHSNINWGPNTCANAVQYEHFEVLKWIVENGCRLKWECCMYAAENGRLDILIYLRNQLCPWNDDVCYTAARSGHLHIIKWCKENGARWKSSLCSPAARHGHLHILMWAIENGCEWNKNKCLEYAKNHQHVIDWIMLQM